jgi:hypothetical protein
MDDATNHECLPGWLSFHISFLSLAGTCQTMKAKLDPKLIAQGYAWGDNCDG